MGDFRPFLFITIVLLNLTPRNVYLFIGLILLIASLISVNLNKFSRQLKTNNYYDLITIFDFFDDFVKFIFMRKQNLVDQNISNPSTKIFKKKISK